MFFKKTLPFLLLLFIGGTTFLYFFIPHRFMADLWDIYVNWIMIIAGAAMGVGAISMARSFYKKTVAKNAPNRFYSFIALVSMAAMAIIGLVGGIEAGTLFSDLYKYVMSPLNSTMFALLAFYISSAAFRSFRLKTFSAGLLMFTALLVMLAQVPVGELIHPSIPPLKEWVMRVPNVAGQRAIMIGVAVGGVATALKIILGIDKSIFSTGK